MTARTITPTFIFMPARRDMARFGRHYEYDVSGCVLWTGSKTRGGYGLFRLDGRVTTAHRASWELHRGPIPDGFDVDHLCRVRACVHPDHLEPVTPAENRRRQGAAVSHCPSGHPYTAENTYIGRVRGERRCRTCARERQRVSR